MADAETPDWLAALTTRTGRRRLTATLWEDPPPAADHYPPWSDGPQVDNGDEVPLLPLAARWRLRHAVQAERGRWARAYDGTRSSAQAVAHILHHSFDLDVAVRGFGTTVAVFARWAPNPRISKEPRRLRRAGPRQPSVRRVPAPRPASGPSFRVDNRVVHRSHDPEPDGHRAIPGLRACRRCLRFLVVERGSWRVTADGAAPCKGDGGSGPGHGQE
jgi:hypothetical protein